MTNEIQRIREGHAANNLLPTDKVVDLLLKRIDELEAAMSNIYTASRRTDRESVAIHQITRKSLGKVFSSQQIEEMLVSRAAYSLSHHVNPPGLKEAWDALYEAASREYYTESPECYEYVAKLSQADQDQLSALALEKLTQDKASQRK